MPGRVSKIGHVILDDLPLFNRDSGSQSITKISCEASDKKMSSSRKITQKSLVNFAILKSFKIHPDQWWEPVLSVSKVYSSTVFQSLAFHHETMLVHNMEKHDEPSWFLARFWILVSGFYFQCIAGVYPTYNWVDDHSATDLMTAKCWTFDPYTSTLLVGGLEHLDYYFFYILGMSYSQLLLTPSFFRGIGLNHQPAIDIITYKPSSYFSRYITIKKT